MESFRRTKVVKLRSHHDRFLYAEDESDTVRQSRRGSSSRNTKWIVEIVPARGNAIRLKSMAGKYLAASDEQFLLGLTGKKVVQISPEKPHDWRLEWEVIGDGFQVKLRSWCGKFLRANGGTPPWKNSITHDEPHAGATARWVLWDVEALVTGDTETLEEYISFVSNVSSLSVDVIDAASDSNSVSDSGSSSPVSSMASPAPTNTSRFIFQKTLSPRLFSNKMNSVFNNYSLGSFPTKSTMEFFHNASAVRLKSRHDKYLFASDDKESVEQDRDGSSKSARWTVEPLPGTRNIVRLKSCFGKYLTASNQPFFLGMTGCKVLQTLPGRLDSSLEWEPIEEGKLVKLRTRYGNFLRANGGIPPWRNSVTHDIPSRSATQDWILWSVDVVEIQTDHSPAEDEAPLPMHQDSLDFAPSSPTGYPGGYSRQESTDSYAGSPPRSEGRTIYYHVADANGEVDEDLVEPYSVMFKGNSVDELTRKLTEETGQDDAVVCARSRLNGKLYPLKLQLPPNNADMHVVVVSASTIR